MGVSNSDPDEQGPGVIPWTVRSRSIPRLFRELSGSASAAADQVDDYDNQRYHEQQVNQASGNMQAEAQQPKNQKHRNNCPKHISLLNVLPLACILPLDWKGSKGLPAL